MDQLPSISQSWATIVGAVIGGICALAAAHIMTGGKGARSIFLTVAIFVAAMIALLYLGGRTPENETPVPEPASLNRRQEAIVRAQNFREGNNDWAQFVDKFDGVEMVLVPVGCFMMGGTVDPDERPPHDVCFDEPFWIDRTEVTNTQFTAFNGQATRSSNFQGDNRPRESITWFEAQHFCESRGARLPTEAEWEYAVRGPDSWEYPWGNEWDPGKTVWGRNSDNQTADVGSKPGGKSWVGALDMSGNVWEWVADWYSPNYSEGVAGNPTNPSGPASGTFRVAHGGSWATNNPNNLRAASRDAGFPSTVIFTGGFRCVSPID